MQLPPSVFLFVLCSYCYPLVPSSIPSVPAKQGCNTVPVLVLSSPAAPWYLYLHHPVSDGAVPRPMCYQVPVIPLALHVPACCTHSLSPVTNRVIVLVQVAVQRAPAWRIACTCSHLQCLYLYMHEVTRSKLLILSSPQQKSNAESFFLFCPGPSPHSFEATPAPWEEGKIIPSSPTSLLLVLLSSMSPIRIL